MMTTTIKPYLIRLTPVGSFFFGGEKNLAGAGNANYFVRSRHFPQQTSLLGLLRMQLLSAYDMLPEPYLGRAIANPVEAKDKIGGNGFRHNQSTAYGEIHALGPVLLARGDEFFAPMAFSSEIHFSEKEGRFASVLAENDFGNVRTYLPTLKDFSPKKTPPEQVYGSAGSPSMALQEIFREKTRVGITKNKKHFPWLYADEKTKNNGEAEMEGFFKQVSLYFNNEAGKKPWQFAFAAWLGEAAGGKLMAFAAENPIVWFGGERSAFRFEMSAPENLPDFTPAFPIQEKGLLRLVLLSDAWAKPGEVYPHCQFAHAETQEFRFLKSEVDDTKNYYQRGDNTNSGESIVRSDRHTLVSRGSVFFCQEDQLENLKQALEKPIDFRRIGYNAFTVLKGQVETNFFIPTSSPSL